MSFVPNLPLQAEREAWRDAAAAAQHFWSSATDEPRISGGFRALCTVNLEAVKRAAELEKRA